MDHEAGFVACSTANACMGTFVVSSQARLQRLHDCIGKFYMHEQI